MPPAVPVQAVRNCAIAGLKRAVSAHLTGILRQKLPMYGMPAAKRKYDGVLKGVFAGRMENFGRCGAASAQRLE
jgi:hypothetical protein